MLEGQRDKQRWQKIIKPVLPMQFSSALNHALHGHQDVNNENATDEMRATSTKPALRRSSVYFTLHQDPHVISDNESEDDSSHMPPEPDPLYERILASVLPGGVNHHHRKGRSGSPGTGKSPRSDSPVGEGARDGNVSPFISPSRTPGKIGESRGSESNGKASTRLRVHASPIQTLELLKAHPKVGKNLVGLENIFSLQKEYGGYGSVTKRREIVSDTDGSLAYLKCCRNLGVPPNRAFISQFNDEFIFMRHASVGPRGGQAIGKSLSLNPRPVDVDMGFCEIGHEGVTALADGLNKTGVYRSLDLTGNRMGKLGADAITACLIERASTSHLTRLILRSNQLADTGATTIAKVLNACMNLEYLDLSSNKIGTDGARAIGQALEQHAKLEETGSPIRTSSVQRLKSGAAQGNTDVEGAAPPKTNNATKVQKREGGLLHLDMSGNELGDKGARALCTGLFKNSRLQTLILAHNDIRNAGAKAIAETMIHNDAMTHLDISHNKITGIGGLHIVRSVKLDRKTSFLDISHNLLSAQAVVGIAEAARKQEPIRLLNLWNTCAPNNAKKPRKVVDRTFACPDDLQAYIKEVQQSMRDIQNSSNMYEEQLHQAKLQSSRMKADPAQMRSSELSELQSGASNMNVTLEYARTAALQFEALLEEANSELEDWRHLESALDSIEAAEELMHFQEALNLVEGRYELFLGDPWHYFVFINVLQAQPATLGLVVEVEYMKKGWPVPYVATEGSERAFCDEFAQPVFYKRALSQQIPRLDVDQVPKGGVAILRIHYVASVVEHKFELDLATTTGSSTLQTLKSREKRLRSCEQCAHVTYEQNSISCFDHAKWTIPARGEMRLSFRMLKLEYDPEDLWGTLTLDLSLPWENLIAANLYSKARSRALLRQRLVAPHKKHALHMRHVNPMKVTPTFIRQALHLDATSTPHVSLEEDHDLVGTGIPSRDIIRPVDQLPDWEANCRLDGLEVPFDTMLAVPSSGKLTFEVKHHQVEPRYSQAVVLHLQIAAHRWIAERFWLRCFDEDGGKKAFKAVGDRRKESFFDCKEFILEYPTLNSLEYQGMHKHAAKVRQDRHEAKLLAASSNAKEPSAAATSKESVEALREESRWLAPSGGDTEATLSFIFVLQDSHYVKLHPQTWDLDVEEDRVDADHLFTSDEFLSLNQVQIMARDVRSARQLARSAQPLPMPCEHQHRTLWRLPQSGVVSAQRGRLLIMHNTKPSSQTVSGLLAALEEARKTRSKQFPLVRLREMLAQQPQYRMMVAEQAIKVLEQIFSDDENSMIEAASILYDVSPEPQRFLLQLADHTAPSLARAGAPNIKFKHQSTSSNLL